MQQIKYEGLNVHDQKLLLLKTLGFSDALITEVQSGETLLSEALQRRINEVINNPNDTTQCAIVCQNIRRDGASYETLEPVQYLEHINELIGRGGSFCDPNQRNNFNAYESSNRSAQNPGMNPDDGQNININSRSNNEQLRGAIQNPEKTPVFAVYPRPFVRFFARTIDLSIYMLLIGLCFRILIGVNPLQDTRLMTAFMVAIYVCAFSIEPLILHYFGTTPGKLIFGIKILSVTGNKLSIKEAYLRSFRLLRFGYGFMIPFYNIFKMGMCLYLCKQKQPMPWDYGMLIAAPETVKPKHITLFVITFLTVSFIDTMLGLALEVPRTNGAFTEAAFNDSCAHIVRYDGITFSDMPDYTVQTDSNGNVISVTYTVETTDADTLYPFYDEMFVAYLSMVSQSKQFGLISFNFIVIPNYFKNCFADFEFEYAGYKASNHVEYNGYARNVLSGYLYEKNDVEEHTFRQVFTISKIN